ncbi:class I adenylate-forming enzyme family protein [Dehalogenimonas etheniformans]|uniref:class I adenylate-forming enzyme family protein n=1 Tax=Dehalogenimonas etheniformans TaxID=1536648 RepID=UPI00167F615F|nr:AMP-binding protein [Dehalogenimonas etheniformans]QNT77124.1 AMP-binding protein [Dehalogenimonas etheniformans]
MLLQNFLESTAELFPAKTAIICGKMRLTYQEMEYQANALANALIEQGLKRHDRVAILLENSIEVVVSLFAILKIGAVFSVLDHQIKSRKLKFILNDCQSRAIITDFTRFQTLVPVLGECSDLHLIVLTDINDAPTPVDDRKIMSYPQALARYPRSKPGAGTIDVDLASLIYTSGSTGEPKGVMLTHLNMVTAATSIVEYLENSPGDIILDALPLSFDYGLYQVLMAVKFGGTVILEKSFAFPYRIIDSIINNHVTGFPVVPTMVAILLRLKNLDGLNLDSLRYISSTGQALPLPHINRLRSIFPKVKIFSMYGLTECKRVSYLPPCELDRRPSSVGIAIPNTEVYLIDAQGNRISEPNVVGELVVRGSTVMRGYWNRPVENARALHPGFFPGEQVLHTGDLFKQDKDGFLYFIARRDEMFKSGGELVSPKEIEEVLCSCPGITEAAVIAVEDQILGNSIKAYVVVDEHYRTQITNNMIIEHCATRLKGSMVPKVVEFRADLPKDNNGKVQKSLLAKRNF